MVRLFSHYVPSSALFHLVLDTALLFIAILLAFGLQYRGSVQDIEIIAPSALTFACAMMVLNSALGLYRGTTRFSTLQQKSVRVGLSLLLSVPVAYGIFHVLPWRALGQGTAELTVLLALSIVIAFRGFFAGAAAAPLVARRVLVIGTGEEALAVQRSIEQAGGPAVQVVGFYPIHAHAMDAIRVSAARILPRTTSISATVRNVRADEVVVAVRERRGGALPMADLLECKLSGVKVLDLSSFFERTLGQVRVDSLRASWLIYGDGFRQGWFRTTIKRAFDTCAALVLLILASPTMLLTAILIVLEDGFPIFYRQQRVGQGGRVFDVIKFRSMRNDAEKDGRPQWAARNDDRVTRVGQIIRKLRIDELPQLLNVLRGEMSLVGPRPERPFFVDQLNRDVPFYAARHSVKPGVTGWAQVRYHYGASVNDAVEKLQYDLYYVKNHTLFLDLVVLLETVRVVLTGEGAQ
jgi:sugar transferase (PEP-CTERM system associated)